MSYVDEVYARVVRENPSQPEFHRDRPQIARFPARGDPSATEKYRHGRSSAADHAGRQILFRVPWVDDQGQVQVKTPSAGSFPAPSARIRAACACIRASIWASSNSLGFEQTAKETP